MRVLVVNCGSSSLKYALFENGVAKTKGVVERIGTNEAVLKRGDTQPIVAPDHATALRAVVTLEGFAKPDAVGHRVVHGGERFVAPTQINASMLAELEPLSLLAPLHNPANIAGIRAAQELFVGVPQVAVFDTAFHATLPKEASTYAIGQGMAATRHWRRFGFHGTSHAYVAHQAAAVLRRSLAELRVVSLHLGNGASACAILHGQSVDTSMGFTPLEGLVMGTRSGDIDAGLVLAMAKEFGVPETETVLNKQSGLLGLCGKSDLRDVNALVAAGDDAARLALAVYAHRARKTVAAMAASMNGLDVLVFTAGVGENDAAMRARIMRGLEFLGLVLDENANAQHGPVIGVGAASAVVVATDEERAIGEAVRLALGG